MQDHRDITSAERQAHLHQADIWWPTDRYQCKEAKGNVDQEDVSKVAAEVAEEIL